MATGDKIDTLVTLVTTECITCGAVFALPKTRDDYARKAGNASIHCPSGHPQQYTDTEYKRLQNEVDAARIAKVAAESKASDAINRAYSAEARANTFQYRENRRRSEASKKAARTRKANRKR
jgi:hypothetical protein